VKKLPITLIATVWLLVWSNASASETVGVTTNAPACIELHDQYDSPQKLTFPTTNITILTISDRKGSEQMDAWIAVLKPRCAGRISLRGIAAVGGAPAFIHAKIRKKFQETRQYPVMMDWTGEVCAQLSYQKDLANILVLDRNGRIQARFTGVATAAAIAEVGAVLDKLLATAEEQKP
jgi:hypothetical protein